MKKSKRLPIIIVLILTLVIGFLLYFIYSEKPFKTIDVNEIEEIKVFALPPEVDNLNITPMEQVVLEQAHYKKIELSDAIYVVDIQGYIGNQVSKEIAFAKSKGKEVIFHSVYREN